MQLAFLIINRIAFKQFHCEPKYRVQVIQEKSYKDFWRSSTPFHTLFICHVPGLLFCLFSPLLSQSTSQSQLHVNRWRLWSTDAAFWHLPTSPMWSNTAEFWVFWAAEPVGRHVPLSTANLASRTCFPGHQPGGHMQGQNMFCNLSPDDLVSLGTYFWVDYAVDNKNTHT